MPESSATSTFRRNQRLTEGAQFRQVFEAARRSSDRYFTVLAIPNNLGRPRLGMAIGRKRIRRAVGRNRIKRLIRESFRVNAGDITALDLVVMSRFDGHATNQEIVDSLSKHWARLSR